MKHFFKAHSLGIGAIVGVVLFAATEVFAAFIREVYVAHSSGSSWDLTAGLFGLIGVIKSLIFGILLGRIGGLAAREWFVGERDESKRTLRVAGIAVVGFYAVVFSFFFAGTAPNLLFNTALSAPQRTQELLEAYFASFPLQVGIIFWILARCLPDESIKTT